MGLESNLIRLEDGQPIVFGPEGSKVVVRTASGHIEVADASDVDPSEVIVHDSHAEDPGLAFAAPALQPNVGPTGQEPLLGGALREQAVWVDEAVCIGCRYCAHVAANTFVVEQEWGRSRAIRQDGDSTALIQEAIDTCPVDCIHWVAYEALPQLVAQLAEQARRTYLFFNNCHAGQAARNAKLMQELLRQQVLERLVDPDEFMSDFGLRSLSRVHLHAPFVLGGNAVNYEAGEADCKIKGGNSNWRGPIWFPTAFLMIESLRKLAKAYGDDFTVIDKTGRTWTLGEIAKMQADRLIAIFTRDASGRRPEYGNITKFQEDPHWRDYITFHEYFHGDTGVGLGASHQTGWTGLVASLIDEWRAD